MKYLIFALLPLFGYSQTLPELIVEYENYCNEIVAYDTILLTAYLSERHEIVIKEEGKWEFVQKVDTMWEGGICKDYLIEDIGIEDIGIENGQFFSPRYYIQPGIKGDLVETSVTKLKICPIRRQKMEAFSYRFWEWLKSR